MSDADRGVLLTRPYFDICDEPDQSPAKPSPAVRTGLKKTLNKMSFKDYKRQKEKVSTSPTEHTVPGKLDEKNHTSVASAVKLDKESPRKEMDRYRDRSRERDPGPQRDSKAQELRLNGDSDRYAQRTCVRMAPSHWDMCTNLLYFAGPRALRSNSPREMH